jgi:uncharacterized protein YjbI with pentapeptide repeats
MTIYSRDGAVLLESTVRIQSFDELNLIDPSFIGLEMEGASFEACNLVRPDFTDADLYWASFYDTNFVVACFKRASLRGANLYQCNFVFADFTDADLSRDSLNGTARFEHCNFQRATFVGADLSGVKHENTNFKDATYSPRTRFAEDFDPVVAGMRQVEDSESLAPQKHC